MATPAEMAEIKDSLKYAVKQLERVAYGLLKDKEMHGCPYLHLEIAARILQEQFPCEECCSLKNAETKGIN